MYTYIYIVLQPSVTHHPVAIASVTGASASRVSVMADTIVPDAAAQAQAEVVVPEAADQAEVVVTGAAAHEADVGQPTGSGQQSELEEILRTCWDEPVKAVGIPASWNMPEKTKELEQKLQAVAAMVKSYCPTEPVQATQPAGVTKLEELLKAALDAGKIEMRSSTGQWFYKELKLDEKLKADYASLGKSYDKQREFRLKYAATRYNLLQQTRTKREETFDLSKVDAEYCTFGRMVQREGGDPPAFETSKTFVRNAMQLWQQGKTFHGHPWVKHDPMRGGAVVLHYRETVCNGSKKSWELATTETTGVPATGTNGTVSATDTTATGNPETRENFEKNTGKNKNGKRTKQDPKQEQDPKRFKEEEEEKALKKRFAAAISKANALKAAVLKSSQAGADVLTLVAQNPEWAWCNNEALLAGLREAMAAVGTYKKSNAFWKAWTVEENLFAYARKHFAMDYVIAQVTQAEAGEHSLKDLHDRVVKETGTLKRMQASRFA